MVRRLAWPDHRLTGPSGTGPRSPLADLRRRQPAGFDVLDHAAIAAAVSPRYIYRVARHDTDFDGRPVAAGDTAQLKLAEINEHLGAGHLAFGHGLHRCLGAALSRLVLRVAIPVFDPGL